MKNMPQKCVDCGFWTVSRVRAYASARINKINYIYRNYIYRD